MDESTTQPPPPAPMDAESAAFLSAPTPRRDIPKKITRAAYEQMALTQEFFASVSSISWGIFILAIMGPLIILGLREVRPAGSFFSVFQLAWAAFMVLLGIIMIIAGIRSLRIVLGKRARCRWLLETGVTGEFFVDDVDIVVVRRGSGQKTRLIHVFQLKPVNDSGDKHSYFSQLTKDSQIDYANALRRAKTPTFGLYDPTSTDDKRMVLMV